LVGLKSLFKGNLVLTSALTGCGKHGKMFLSVLDKHAPIREKRVKSKPNIPWLTNAIKKQIRERDRFKFPLAV
jgi:predicted small lipoprotein YifL